MRSQLVSTQFLKSTGILDAYETTVEQILALSSRGPITSVHDTAADFILKW